MESEEWYCCSGPMQCRVMGKMLIVIHQVDWEAGAAALQSEQGDREAVLRSADNRNY